MQLIDLFGYPQPTESEIEKQNDFQMLSLLKSFFVLFEEEESLNVFEKMIETLREKPTLHLATQYLKKEPDCKSIIQKRYIAPPHDLEKLLHYPQDSLGHIYATTVKAKGLDPDLYSDINIESDISYVEARISQTHDIWHIVTGFDTSPIDEMALMAFYLAQFPYPLATILVVANNFLVNGLLVSEDLPGLMAKGWKMGKKAKPLFPQKWEDAWEKPLSQWKQELNIQLS